MKIDEGTEPKAALKEDEMVTVSVVGLCEVEGCTNPAACTVRFEDGETMKVCAECIEPV